jgi:hypothetical protein
VASVTAVSAARTVPRLVADRRALHITGGGERLVAGRLVAAPPVPQRRERLPFACPSHLYRGKDGWALSATLRVLAGDQRSRLR